MYVYKVKSQIIKTVCKMVRRARVLLQMLQDSKDETILGTVGVSYRVKTLMIALLNKSYL